MKKNLLTVFLGLFVLSNNASAKSVEIPIDTLIKEIQDNYATVQTDDIKHSKNQKEANEAIEKILLESNFKDIIVRAGIRYLQTKQVPYKWRFNSDNSDHPVVQIFIKLIPELERIHQKLDINRRLTEFRKLGVLQKPNLAMSDQKAKITLKAEDQKRGFSKDAVEEPNLLDDL